MTNLIFLELTNNGRYRFVDSIIFKSKRQAKKYIGNFYEKNELTNFDMIEIENGKAYFYESEILSDGKILFLNKELIN